MVESKTQLLGLGGVLKALVVVPTYKDGKVLNSVLDRFPPLLTRGYAVLVVDDGTPGFNKSELERLYSDILFLCHPSNMGVGAVYKTAITFTKQCGYEVIIFLSGNGKTHPEDVPALLKKIRDGYDCVFGSRFLGEGTHENLPLFRLLCIPLLSWIMGKLARWEFSDVTCGVCAYRLDWIDPPFMDIYQSWLSRYEMEYYLKYKAVELRKRICELPIHITYKKDETNSKIRPVIDWWYMIRPFILLRLGLKK